MAASTMTSPVPTMANATSGVYPRPSPSVTATVTRNDTRMATNGELCRWCTRAKKCGNAPIRPIA
jgi:hypothetical protein